jgi:glutamate mutase epsilon subunit
MMDEFKALNIKHSYTGHGTKILSEFLLPVLANAISYDRVTSFYTIDSLIAISQGIDSLYRHNWQNAPYYRDT